MTTMKNDASRDGVPPPAGTIVEVRTTFSRREAADACAARLVSERLAACVQIDGPVRSVYRWEGSVESAEEFRCTAKTSRAQAEACAAGIIAGHEYRLPELIVSVAATTAAYAAWIEAAVGPERPLES